ncbi:pyrimidine metabolism oxidoreductase [Salmonella enterica subsp. enterica]|uniref:Pyrimidine metabolism oxidoreductase n=1 Tax=Salmonella enterica I TaxID=59201 RepID=A0A3S4HUK9_SALET|nr:pyrimidine metabolism oxidoreductase [Salmonella enterica subsp. enterica]
MKTWEDAAEFLLLGAATLQVTTGIMQYGYRIVEDMASGLSHYLADQGFASLQEMIGLGEWQYYPGGRPWIAAISFIRGLNQEKLRRLRTFAISPAMTAAIRRWSGMNTAARRIAIRKNASVVCCAVMSARSPVLDLGEVKFKKRRKRTRVNAVAHGMKPGAQFRCAGLSDKQGNTSG